MFCSLSDDLSEKSNIMFKYFILFNALLNDMLVKQKTSTINKHKREE